MLLIISNVPDLWNQIAFNVIASYLSNHENGEVAFIDTTGSFSPLRLRDVLACRLLAQSQRARYQQAGYMYEKLLPGSDAVGHDATEKATSMLDRVKVMRVFDFAGVVEAIGEVGQTWEAVIQAREDANDREAQSKKGAKGVADSEDEAEEMLDDLPDPERQTEEETPSFTPSDETGQVGVIVIDTITNVVSSMISKSQIQGLAPLPPSLSSTLPPPPPTNTPSGQALLTTSFRTLSHLTHRHHILTLLINAAVGLTPSNPFYPRRPDDNASIFGSTQGKPALGRVFAYLIDTSIFMSMVPKRKEDAEVAFGGGQGKEGGWEKVGVMEVVRDRNGGREGRWGVFEVFEGVEVRGVGF